MQRFLRFGKVEKAVSIVQKMSPENFSSFSDKEGKRLFGDKWPTRGPNIQELLGLEKSIVDRKRKFYKKKPAPIEISDNISSQYRTKSRC